MDKKVEKGVPGWMMVVVLAALALWAATLIVLVPDELRATVFNAWMTVTIWSSSAGQHALPSWLPRWTISGHECDSGFKETERSALKRVFHSSFCGSCGSSRVS
ncbi:hypothetical protein COT44_03850 [Candidatus Shapirobacteria bacterium CG08_land_8_20_14_0_20_39_18]|uniref:Uncharacterized protein n=1 Tax=Candidatus Shapirobacteria bacterium CG08_land_8_20_14_0_20_39_18 TaxID=1974883 RepID=A0A2M6XCE9_9BACT|nr:MAG: hypothetical protein COT44_03850 [Candidatus Shapirobacteria bacterium CG08_land_8_20_14_0_20_39_18]PIY65577.1 MAG: hypothetical protein COY91_02205 [Candidatus Shapirobacteria bacterium CG_4_10_14_0_8_um_filter_39_15]PJE68795.1 MAG: hypothetical protein COU94_00280 [Candidatus Shapirobacteria bacterium CG10_big_fil_rev_8_21_14_0_10_38_8]